MFDFQFYLLLFSLGNFLGKKLGQKPDAIINVSGRGSYLTIKMQLYFSQPDMAEEWRPKLRKLFIPILNTYRSQGLVCKVLFLNKDTGTYSGNFRAYRDHRLYSNEFKRFGNISAVITLKICRNTIDAKIFALFAHEFYHWRQSNVRKINAWGKIDYSERCASKWEKKMTKKYHPEVRVIKETYPVSFELIS